MTMFDKYKKKPLVKHDESSNKRRPLPTKKDVANLYVPNDNILVYRVMPSMVTSGGLMLPVEAIDNSGVEFPHMGVVLAAGSKLDADVFKYGVFVYYNQFGGRRFKNQATEQDCVIVGINDILVVDSKFKAYDYHCVLEATEVIVVEEQAAEHEGPKIITPSSSIIH